jgi:hypothetical protein
MKREDARVEHLRADVRKGPGSGLWSKLASPILLVFADMAPQVFNQNNDLKYIEFWRARKDFEPLTPRFVVWSRQIS